MLFALDHRHRAFRGSGRLSTRRFRARSRTALNTASERVRSKFGMGCAQAMVQIASIEATAARFASTPNAAVRVERFER